MKRNLIIFSIALMLPLGAVAQCKCPAPAKNAKEAYEQSTVSFVGRTEKLEKSALHKDYNEATFVVLRRFKGFEEVKGDTIFIYTPLTKENCGIDLVMGQDYLVYGTGNPAKYVITSCGRTGVLDLMLEDVEQLSNQVAAKKN